MKKIYLVLFILLIVLCGCTEEVKEEPKKEYYCDEGYELEKASCVKKELVKDATKNLSCDVGYELSGEDCKKYDSISYENKTSCKSGYKEKDGVCTRTLTTKMVEKTVCPDGYTLGTVYDVPGKFCKKGDQAIAPTYSFSCPSSYTYDNGICTKTEIIAMTYTKVCKSGYTLIGNICKKLVDTKKANEEYSCDKELKLEKDKCYKIDKVDAKEK